MTRRLLTIAVLTFALALPLAAPAGAAPGGAALRGEPPFTGWAFARWVEELVALIQGGSPLARASGAEGHATDPDGAPSSGTSSGGGQPIDLDAASAGGDEGHATDPDGLR